MSNYYVKLPVDGVPIYASAVNFPISAITGSLAVAVDTSTLYEWNGSSWVAIATPGAAIALDGLIGDVSATGPGVAVATLATVNSNVGSFGSSTAIPTITVNAKGLTTAVSTNAVIAPAGTLSGTTLNSSVTGSSLTSVGTITSGTWNGTTIAIANGGTGQTTAAAAFNALSPMTTTGDITYESGTNTSSRLAIGTTGQVLSVESGIPAWHTLDVSQMTIGTQAIASTTIDWSTGNLFTQTLSANTTFTFSNQRSGQTIVVRLTNTASNYTVTWPSLKWPNQTAPTMTTGAFSDVYTFVYDGTNVYGSFVQNF